MRIEVRGIRAHGWHGVFDEERREGQEFIVDVALDVDATDAVVSDDLAHTVDYGAIAQLVHGRIVGEPRNLIEALADDIAGDIIAVERVHSVTVTVHKPHAPVGVPFTDVTVTSHRVR